MTTTTHRKGAGVMEPKEHEPIICPRDFRSTQYVGKGYKSKFTCPSCSRSTWQHIGFLGQRNVICNGVRFTKEYKPEFTHRIYR